MNQHKPRFYKIIIGSLSILVVFFLGLAVKHESSSETRTLFAAGDTMLARWMHQIADSGTANEMFGRILPAMQDADVAFVNLECVLSNRGQMAYKKEYAPYYYRARPEMARFLKEAGIDIVSQANNHVGDFGPRAVTDSIATLGFHDILSAGVGVNFENARQIHYIKVGKIQTAWIAFDTQENRFAAGEDFAGSFSIKESEIVQVIPPLIAQARKNADVVILTAHWGGNWQKAPTDTRREIARRLIDFGADIILGHSSHRLQGIEVYRQRPILYDMGSFLWDSVGDKRVRDSMYFELLFSKSGVLEVRGHPVYLNWRSVDLASPEIAGKIMDDFIERSKSLNGELIFDRNEDTVRISLKPRKRTSLRKLFRFVNTRQTTVSGPSKKPDFDFTKKPPCVLTQLPAGVDTTIRASFENGMEYLGSVLSKEIPQRYGFVMTLFFSTQKTVNGKACEIHITLSKPSSQKSSKEMARDHHEPGEWAYPTTLWKKGEIIEDRHLFRTPRNLPIGQYDIYLSVWQYPNLKAKKNGEFVRVKAGSGYSDGTKVKIGTIKITKGGPNDTIKGLVT
jgi:poly-gamma-glutamate capsule biosynthesis protein CapA/YwtB (metallophosphatase superfamily)